MSWRKRQKRLRLEDKQINNSVSILLFQAIREMEERLMASAFYDLSMKMHRGAVEDRLKNLSQGQSFLARQRQVNTRKGVYNGGQGPEYFSNYE